MRTYAAAFLITVSAPAVAVPADFDRTASAMLSESVPPSGPGVATIVTRDGQLLWAGAAGQADLASGAAVRTDSLFRYASITKQFTAALILKLHEEGRLSLDEEVGKLLPAETPAAWHKVTVRQLLNHTSGIPSYTSKPGFMTEDNTARPHSIQQLIDLTRDQPLDFAPGTDWRYNNTGYVLLSAIAERLTGGPWYAALKDRITGPLGLSSIRCGCEAGPTAVTGYTQENAVAQAIDMTVPSGAGALVGTAGDLAAWAAALHGGKVLKPATYQAMIAQTVLSGGRTIPYGFGLGIREVRGLTSLEHSGGIFGFSTESIYLPERRLFVAALGNSDAGAVDPGSLARRLVAEAAGVPYPTLKAQSADLGALAPLFGVYKDEGGERRFFAKDGRLYSQRSGGSRFAVQSAGSGRFFYGPTSLSYFDLGTGSDGKPVMTFHANGAVKGEVAQWVGPIPPEVPVLKLGIAELDRLTGSYVGPAPMIIARDGEKLTGKLGRQPAVELEAIGPREFRTVGIDARLLFEEANGAVVRLVLHQGGQSIPFQRQ